MISNMKWWLLVVKLLLQPHSKGQLQTFFCLQWECTAEGPGHDVMIPSTWQATDFGERIVRYWCFLCYDIISDIRNDIRYQIWYQIWYFAVCRTVWCWSYWHPTPTIRTRWNHSMSLLILTSRGLPGVVCVYSTLLQVYLVSHTCEGGLVQCCPQAWGGFPRVLQHVPSSK